VVPGGIEKKPRIQGILAACAETARSEWPLMESDYRPRKPPDTGHRNARVLGAMAGYAGKADASASARAPLSSGKARRAFAAARRRPRRKRSARPLPGEQREPGP
jgi:hypothetical protein